MKNFFTFLLTFCIGAGMSQSIKAEVGETFDDGILGYQITNENPNQVCIDMLINENEIPENWYIPSEVEFHEQIYTITSIGVMAPFRGCKKLNTVHLPNTINEIGREAFSDSSLVNITLSNSIKFLNNDRVFYGCKNLVSVELPESLESIGIYTFGDCPSLKSIVFPPNLNFIQLGAFLNCSGLTELTFPKSLTTIGMDAFSGCPITTVTIEEGASTFPALYDMKDLKYVNLPSSLQNLPPRAFNGCISLETVSLPSNIESIGDYAFNNCQSLMDIEIPAAVSSIGNNCFNGCTSLTTLRLPEKVRVIPNNTFVNCENLEKVYFSDKVESFGMNAFQNCISLRSLVIPEGVKEIPSGLLQGCSSISEILVPNSVTTIASKAFQGCSSLRNVDLGTGMYSIGDYAFADCDNITNIHSMALNPPYAEMYTFPTQAYTNATVTVREQSLATYNRENPWYRFQNYLTVTGAISLSHYNVDMAGNEVFQLGVYGSDNKIEWTSSNPSVAYANECGLIVAMGITGATVITAHVDGEEINCNVTVSSPYRDPTAYTRAGEDEELQPVDIIMEGVGGNPPMVNVRLVPVGSKTIIDWTSSDSALASVNNGLVTVYADGDVDFGVETENGIEESVEVDTQNIDQARIEEIFSDGDIIQPLNVYDLSGKIIFFNATLEQIKALDKGLYIIKGKKVLIK